MLSVRKVHLGQVDQDFSADWQRLLETAGVDLSMSYEWFASTVQARKLDARAHVFATYRNGALVGVLPYVERRDRVLHIPVRAVESPGSYLVAYHPEVIAPGNIEMVLGAIIEECARNNDVVVLPNLPANSESAAAVHAIARRGNLTLVSRPGHASPYLSITSRWDEFIAGKDKKFRYKVRNVRKDLEAAGQVTEQWYTNSEGLDTFLAHMLSIEANSWKAGAGMAVSGSEMERVYYQKLLPFLAARDALRANVLYLDAAPVAYSLCYVWGGAFRQLKTSFDQRVARLSAGSVVLQDAIRKAFDSGASEFDFLGDAMLHKNQWATNIRQHETAYLFLGSWRGRLSGCARRVSDWLRTRGSALSIIRGREHAAQADSAANIGSP